MKFILSRPNVRLIDIVSEFERIKVAHKLDNQEVKLGKVLVDSVFDFSSLDIFTECISKVSIPFLLWENIIYQRGYL